MTVWRHCYTCRDCASRIFPRHNYLVMLSNGRGCKAERLRLQAPVSRHGLEKGVQFERRRLPPVQDGLDDSGRKQDQPQDATLLTRLTEKATDLILVAKF